MNLARMVEIFRDELTHGLADYDDPSQAEQLKRAFVDRCMNTALVKIVMEQQQEQTGNDDQEVRLIDDLEGVRAAMRNAQDRASDLEDAREPFRPLDITRVRK